jgi:ankyrin repeat protein
VCGNGLLEAVSILIERGSDVNAVDNAGYTPLHHAAYTGKVTAARLVLDAGADVNAFRFDYALT